ncbi:SIMPL domain-containing protein [Pontibacter chitinilyticus]|uniref:SIMPL domain-containing protein n=1 Tax=Pontibacter chitinilyticus TaxID=2674989 RepID=UPI00321A0084
MKERTLVLLALACSLTAFSSCTTRQSDAGENYLQVIGEYEQQMPEAGYRLNLSYNGPVAKRDQFVTWADSLQRKVPNMVKTNENIFINYMPEQMGQKIKPDMYQTSVTYMLTVEDSTLYGQIAKDLLRRNIPFSINVMGTFLNPSQKIKLQETMMEQALQNARTKLSFLAGKGRKYEIIGVEELDNTAPYGPEYYDFNRKMVSRIKVKARLE